MAFDGHPVTFTGEMGERERGEMERGGGERGGETEGGKREGRGEREGERECVTDHSTISGAVSSPP